ncbi:CSC1-like protein ERD4 [Carex littledalei]|uniref:CSC1-like protein ERD4 n=1 Tax=Carex littledalei TaxID=544730 RepID=A0A833R125_9POAL|nr:CSC1-like protein ERD4 [Carex littledalei]
MATATQGEITLGIALTRDMRWCTCWRLAIGEDGGTTNFLRFDLFLHDFHRFFLPRLNFFALRAILRSPEGMRGIVDINLKFEEILNVIGLGLDFGMLISSCSSPIGLVFSAIGLVFSAIGLTKANKIYNSLEGYKKKLAHAEAVFAESKAAGKPEGARPTMRTGFLGLVGLWDQRLH